MKPLQAAFVVLVLVVAISTAASAGPSPSATPTPSSTSTPVPTSTPTSEPTAEPTAIPSASPSSSPPGIPAETPTPQATPTPALFDRVVITCPSIVVSRPVGFYVTQYVAGFAACGAHSVAGEYPNGTAIPPSSFQSGSCSDGRTDYSLSVSAVGNYKLTVSSAGSADGCVVSFQKADPLSSFHVPSVPPWAAIAVAFAGLAIARSRQRRFK